MKTETRPQFEYLLNAMENAAAQDRPADHDYRLKREAVLTHEAELRALVGELANRLMSLQQFAHITALEPHAKTLELEECQNIGCQTTAKLLARAEEARKP